MTRYLDTLNSKVPLVGKRWTNEWLPMIRNRNEAERDADYSSLSDAELDAKLTDMTDWMREMWYIHGHINFALLSGAALSDMYDEVMRPEDPTESYQVLQGHHPVACVGPDQRQVELHAARGRVGALGGRLDVGREGVDAGGERLPGPRRVRDRVGQEREVPGDDFHPPRVRLGDERGEELVAVVALSAAAGAHPDAVRPGPLGPAEGRADVERLLAEGRDPDPLAADGRQVGRLGAGR